MITKIVEQLCLALHLDSSLITFILLNRGSDRSSIYYRSTAIIFESGAPKYLAKWCQADSTQILAARRTVEDLQKRGLPLPQILNSFEINGCSVLIEEYFSGTELAAVIEQNGIDRGLLTTMCGEFLDQLKQVTLEPSSAAELKRELDELFARLAELGVFAGVPQELVERAKVNALTAIADSGPICTAIVHGGCSETAIVVDCDRVGVGSFECAKRSHLIEYDRWSLSETLPLTNTLSESSVRLTFELYRMTISSKLLAPYALAREIPRWNKLISNKLIGGYEGREWTPSSPVQLVAQPMPSPIVNQAVSPADGGGFALASWIADFFPQSIKRIGTVGVFSAEELADLKLRDSIEIVNLATDGLSLLSARTENRRPAKSEKSCDLIVSRIDASQETQLAAVIASSLALDGVVLRIELVREISSGKTDRDSRSVEQSYFLISANRGGGAVLSQELVDTAPNVALGILFWALGDRIVEELRLTREITNDHTEHLVQILHNNRAISRLLVSGMNGTKAPYLARIISARRPDQISKKIVRSASSGELVVSRVATSGEQLSQFESFDGSMRVNWIGEPTEPLRLGPPLGIELVARAKQSSESFYQLLLEFLDWSIRKWRRNERGELGGEALDALWINSSLGVDSDHRFELFDLEWFSESPMPANYFVLRNILALNRLSDQTKGHFAVNSLGALYQKICEDLKLLPDLDQGALLEEKFQRLVSNEPGGSDTKAQILEALNQPIEFLRNEVSDVVVSAQVAGAQVG